MRTIFIVMALGVMLAPLGAAAVDADEDGYDSILTGGTDCNDIDPLVNEAAVESCNGRDDNCDGATDEGFDGDADGFTSCGGDCDDSDAARSPGATETCDGIDNDCDLEVDEGLDGDGDGYTACSDPADCNDADPSVMPGGEEVCNGRDDNCDGVVDEELDCVGDTVNGDSDVSDKEVAGGCACASVTSVSPAPTLGLLVLLGLSIFRRR